MGYDVVCKATLGKQSGEGRAQLETDFLQFRSESLRFKVLLKDLSKVEATRDNLKLVFDGQRAKLELGTKAAAKWAEKILSPPGRLDKLGIKPETTLCLEGGPFELAFTRETEGNPSTGIDEADLIFVAAPSKDVLSNVAAISKRMRRDASFWIIYPKGKTEIRENDVLQAGRAAGLKDVKVMRFSQTETASKFVVPLNARR